MKYEITCFLFCIATVARVVHEMSGKVRREFDDDWKVLSLGGGWL